MYIHILYTCICIYYTYIHIHIYLPGEILDSQQLAILLESGVACAGERSGVLLCQLPLELVAVQGGLLVAGYTHQQDIVGEVVLQVGWKQSVRDGEVGGDGCVGNV